MFNTQAFNTVPFNTADPYLSAVVSVASYNDYSFNSSLFRISWLPNIEDLPVIKYNDYDIAEAHGQGLYSYYFARKVIKISGIIKGDSVSALEDNITSLKAALSQHNKTLKYQRADGNLLETTASCTGIKFNREFYNLTFLPVEIEFTTLEPFFYWTLQQQASFEDKNSDFTGSVAYTTGSFNAFPIILISFGSVSGTSSVEIELNGTTITVNETISSSDSLLINCKTRDVSINSNSWVDYEGTFPELSIGVNSLDVTIDWTWEADIYVLWNNTYV